MTDDVDADDGETAAEQTLGDDVTRDPSPAELKAAMRIAEAVGEAAARARKPTTGANQLVDEDSRDSAGMLSVIPNQRYKIGEEIGRGGMGLVVAARDEQFGRDVAIKLIRGKVPSDRTVHRFVREAKIQGCLEHPAIVPVHEIGRGTDGRPFFAMKKLVGTTLAQILDGPSNPKYPRQRLLRALADVCLAIEFAHTRGYVHRDLKPANIMLGDFGEVYILDWGVAKPIDASADELDDNDSGAFETRAGVAVGTLRYMSPEQLRADRVIDGRSDVYALGAILFEILAGKRLYENGTERLMSGSTSFTRPSQKAPEREIPPELDELTIESLEVDPSNRIASARELGERIQQFLDGDRDVELRKSLARQHLAEAGHAYMAGDSDETRRKAMREAGTALALDPTLRGAAELVSRMMLDPPRSTPKEVDAEIAAADRIALRQVARVAAWSYLAYTIFSIGLFVLAPGYWPYGATMIGLVAFGSIAAARGMTSTGVRLPPTWIVVGGNCLAIFVLARISSPLLIAPGIAAVTATALTLSPRFETQRSVVITACAVVLSVFIPWIVESAGGAARTIEIATGSLTLRAPVLSSPAFTTALMVGYTMSLVAVSTGAVFATRRREREMRRKLQLQAWQLRQLVV